MVLACTDRSEQPLSDKQAMTTQAWMAPSRMPPEFAGLSLDLVEGPRRFSENDLWEHLNGGAHEIVRLGFEQLLVASYREPGTERQVLVEIFYMKSPEAAAALFNVWRSKNAKTGKVCGNSLLDSSFLSWQKEAVYVRLMTAMNHGFPPAVLERVGRSLCNLLT